MENKFLTIKQAAKKLGVTSLTLRNWDKSGKFKPSRHPLNNYRVYESKSVDKLLDDIRENKIPVKKSPKIKQVRRLQVKHLGETE